MTKPNPFRFSFPALVPCLLAVALAGVATTAEATQYLKLTSPAKGSSTAPFASTVTFDYVINIQGFRNFTHWNGILGTWITVCTGGCSATADMIDYHELSPAEQSTWSMPVAKIKQHLTAHNLPIETQIKWNLQFHLPGTFYDKNEILTSSDFYLGHVSLVGPAHLEVKPTATPVPKANPPVR